MKDAIRHLDQRISAFRTLKDTARPPKGWIRAIRNALGMTTAQFAGRLGVSQPRIVAIEKAEATDTITLRSLERAAETLGCRVVYFLVPARSLADTVRNRAQSIAEKKLNAVDQTMRLENQAISAKTSLRGMRQKLIDELMDDPARLWDEK